ncbi:hypothetical protein [Aquimarina brevivitae]|uniref:Lipoprotein n=1 Tax=Aquimarina brevivitae TaxID=323412 RepID=A0A4Q7P388_9FLAO|nr:hypothetical protein [Aquimarina brevivitae]RZS93142.1 hypothetical protein EV197_1712 [Aquimarina brevivitae]
MMKFNNLIFVLFLISCTNVTNKNNYPNVQENDENITLNLPNAIFINEKIKDTIYYKSPLDTINISDIEERFIIFYTATDTMKFKNVKEIESTQHQMFIEEEKGMIPFTIKFDRLGDNYFTGIIEDQVILENLKNGKARIITNESVVTVKVRVKERKKQKI